MSRRGENIYKRKDGRWEGRYICGRKENGRAKYVSVYGRSYGQVKEQMCQRKEEEAAELAKACRLTLRELCLLWLERVRCTVKESSFVRYEFLVEKHILPELGKLHIEELTANVLSQYANQKLKSGRLDGEGGLSAKTVQDILIVIKAVLKMATQEYDMPNPAAAMKLPKATQKEVTVLSTEDLRRLENHAQETGAPWEFGVLICMYTGLRLGELCGLRWSDFDWEQQTVQVRRTAIRLVRNGGEDEAKTRLTLTRPKTRSAERIIPLPGALQRALRKYAVKYSPESYVLTGMTGRFLDPRTLQYRWKGLLKQLNIKYVNFHALRHTFASRCVQCGVDIKSLSEILGHSSVQMTLNRYVHSSLEVKRSQLERLRFVA